MNQPRLMLAAPASGSGKTTLTIGLLQCLLERGMAPTAFKCGPDYIDPLFHREVLGVSGCNLDLFLTTPDRMRGLFTRYAGPDISLIEGVMGYYDGVGMTDRASSWHVARETETPAVLVLRPKGASLSLAAQIKGFLNFREPSMLAGIILNGCSERLHAKLGPMLERETGLPVFGFLPDLPDAMLESRHLGLATPDAVPALREKIALLAAQMRKSVDVDALLTLAASAPPLAASLQPMRKSPSVRIGVARDAAFCFYYRENLDLLRDLGATLVEFSPLTDSALPTDLDGLYLGGGYPELFAPQLAENIGMRHSIRQAITGGLPTLAECGGFLYLHKTLRDKNNVPYPMAGVLDGEGFPTPSLKRFGYLTLTAEQDTLLRRQGESLDAHEFHYWDSDTGGDAYRAAKPGQPEWQSCHGSPTLHAGFPHIYFWNDPAMAERFIHIAQEK